MLRIVPLVVAVVLLVICTVGQGINTQRWSGGTTPRMEAMVTRFDELRAKESFGDWELVEMRELGPGEIKGAGAKNYLSAVYKNVDSQQAVSVLLICGFGRNVAVHTPDRCFVASGMKMHHEPRAHRIQYRDDNFVNADGEEGKERMLYFKTARFRKESEDGPSVDQQTFWAWHSYQDKNETWRAPRDPRMTYGGGTPLVKVYITANHEAATSRTNNPIEDFAKAFLVEVSRIVGAPIETEELKPQDKAAEA